jgi:hypothetical protein
MPVTKREKCSYEAEVSRKFERKLFSVIVDRF